MLKSLRYWILTLIIFTVIGILGSALFSSYVVTRNSLIENSLEQNEVYAQKLSQMTEELFEQMWVTLEARKTDVIESMNDSKKLTVILNQILISGKNFNSLSVIDKEGVAIATSPNVGIAGNRIDSEGVREAIKVKENIVTRPYMATTGRLLILVSTPLFNEKNEYLGMLNGTIYLQEDNFIRKVLVEHYSQDGSYVYVVDKEGTLIYHPQEERIGENVADNKIVQQLLDKKNGSMSTDNTKGDHYLAGYSYIPQPEWGVVSQTPYKSSLQPLIGILSKVFLYSLPLAALFIFIAFHLSTKLAAPLQRLALFTMQRDLKGEALNIPTWYFEAKQLTETIYKYRIMQEATVEDFKNQSLTDVLTGLKNRRYADFLFTSLIESNQTFSIIMLDIDYFKKVNDEFGHKAGDEVLQFLAREMEKVAGEKDTSIRLGGEEFAIVLPGKSEDESYHIAEALRHAVASKLPPTGKPITISNGVGTFINFQEPVADFMNRVDEALYKAKGSGRNQTIKVSEMEQ